MPTKKTTHNAGAASSASQQIDERIRNLGDWRGDMLARVRSLILEADPEITEELKWVKPTNPGGVPVWSRGGIICTGETYKEVVKLTFAKGAALTDPKKLFNASLEGNARRAIDMREGDVIDAKAFKALIQAAIAQNLGGKASTTTSKTSGKKAPPADDGGLKSDATSDKPAEKKVVLLSGGNPQIAKGDGDAPVQEYIAAMPEWKRELGEKLDALITSTVPKVQKAVKWNSPFYGMEGQGWFLSFHVFTKFVKVTFFQGTSLAPIPPGGTPKSKEARWIDIHENEFDEKQLKAWIKQAAATPGWIP